jgi:hypothetical protein
MALEGFNLAESLQRRIGPLPAWGWGVAGGGALLGVKLITGKSLLPSSKKETTATETTSSTDTGSNQGSSSNTSRNNNDSDDTSDDSDSSSNSSSSSSSTTPAMPACPLPYWGWEWRPDLNKWVSVYRTKPSDTVMDWDTKSCTWVLRGKISWGTKPGSGPNDTAQGGTIIRDSAMGATISSSSNGYGGHDDSDMSSVTLAPPDGTPKSYATQIPRNTIPTTPSVAGNTGRSSMSRQSGRPFFGY